MCTLRWSPSLLKFVPKTCYFFFVPNLREHLWYNDSYVGRLLLSHLIMRALKLHDTLPNHLHLSDLRVYYL